MNGNDSLSLRCLGREESLMDFLSTLSVGEKIFLNLSPEGLLLLVGDKKQFLVFIKDKRKMDFIFLS